MSIPDYCDQITVLVNKIREEYNAEHPPAQDETIRVSTQTELQSAIDNLTDKTILLKPGTYDQVILRNGKKGLIIRTDATLPEGRVTLDWNDALIKFKSIKVEPTAEDYLLIGARFLPDNIPQSGTIVSIGNDVETDPLNTPNHISFDQCICNASETGQRKGFAVNCRTFTLTNSLVKGFKYADDAQAINGWNGPGPFVIYNCELSASGETIMFGGSSTRSEAMIPRGLKLFNNILTKDIAWKGDPNATVKNILELKCMIGFDIQNNIFENSWTDGQSGYAIVITPRNQYNNAPYTQVADGTFCWNVIRNAGAGFNVMGDDNLAPSAKTKNIIIEQNLMYDVGKLYDPNGAGRLFRIERAPDSFTIRRNTFLSSKCTSFLDLDKYITTNLLYDNNVISEGTYGIQSPDSFALQAFQNHATGSLNNNLIVPVLSSTNRSYGTTNRRTSEPIVDFRSPEIDKGVDIDQLRRKVTF